MNNEEPQAILCAHCDSAEIFRNGFSGGKQMYKCKACGHKSYGKNATSEIEKKAFSLREGLHNGRASKADRDSSTNGEKLDRGTTGDATEARSNVQIVGAKNTRDVGIVRKSKDNQRGATAKPSRIGRPARRSSLNNGPHVADAKEPGARISGESGESGESIKRGRLIPDDLDTTDNFRIDPFFSRENTRAEPAPAPEKKGKKKEPTPKIEKGAATMPWFKQGLVLSEREAQELEEPLIKSLEDYFQYSDEYIWARTEDVEQMPVWSDGDQEELEALAHVMLQRARHSPAAATIVKAMIAGSDYAKVLAFFVPRTITTVKRLHDAPKKPREPREPRKRRVRE